MYMAEAFFVTPKSGAGGVYLRSQPFVDAVTNVGLVPEGVRLELDYTGADWHACRVYVSTLVAQVSNNFVVLQPNQFQINIRLAPQITERTDIGDLNAGQQLELISSTADWLVARVYMSAQFTDIVSDPQPSPAPNPTPTPTRFPNTALTNAVELANTPLVPAQRRELPASYTTNQITAAKIWNKYGGVIELLAGRINIDVGLAVAVIAVESGGRGFGVDGRLLIRFENHIFWSQWGQSHPDAFQSRFAFNSATTWQGHKYRLSPNAAWKDSHTSQDSEWEAFGVARSLDDRAAKLSISMGLGQIMGFNFATLGYASVENMFDALSGDERLHVLGMFSFIQNRGLVPALQQNNLADFARGYNGSGQIGYYAGLIGGVRDAFNSLATSRAATRAAVAASVPAKRRGRPPKNATANGKAVVPPSAPSIPTLEPTPSDTAAAAMSLAALAFGEDAARTDAARTVWVEPADVVEPNKLRRKRRKRQLEPVTASPRKRGRPRKIAPAEAKTATSPEPGGKRRPGRPRKIRIEAPGASVETPPPATEPADTPLDEG